MKICLVIPAHNEAIVLEKNIRCLWQQLPALLPSIDWEIIISENGSKDEIGEIANRLEQENSTTRVLINPKTGKGLAIKNAWDASDADFLFFMDADLATDLRHLPEFSIALQEADLAIGTRLHPQAVVTRTLTRTLYSRLYNQLARKILALPFSDFQCGFKGIKKEAWKKISPYLLSDGFFFDTELIALAQKFQLKTAELPITWREPRGGKNKSKVRIFKTGKNLIKNLIALKRRLSMLK